MNIRLNDNLQKFYDYIQNAKASGTVNEDAAVQLDGNRELGDATKTAGAVRRWVCLSNTAVEARRANNEVRAQLLQAVSLEFKGFSKIPASVMVALKFDDFDCTFDKDGNATFGSGKPLTQRRITCVLDAVIAAKVKLENEAIMNELKNIEYSKSDDHLATPICNVLFGNPLLMADDHTINELGEMAYKKTKLRMLTHLKTLSDADKSTYLRNLATHAQEEANFLIGVFKKADDKLMQFLQKPEFAKMMSGDDDGKPNDPERLELVKKRLHERAFLGMITNAAPGGAAGSENEWLKNVDEYLQDKELVETTKRIFDKIKDGIDDVLKFECESKRLYGVDIPLKVRNDLISINKLSATKLLEAFGEIVKANGNDANKAIKTFDKLLRFNSLKPVNVKIGSKILESGLADLKMPEKITKESVLKLCRDLAGKVYDGSCNPNDLPEGFGPDDDYMVAAAVVTLLFDVKEDAKDWLDKINAKGLENLATKVLEESIPEAGPNAGERIRYIDARFSRILDILSQIKTFDA